MNVQEKSRKEYVHRINRVMDFIEKNIADPLDLSIIAEQAHFSPYHFHRIFTFLVGETPADFIQRIRLEKAAQLLRTHQEMSVNEIACTCGFGSLSLFSRTFRKHFDITAREFRETELVVYAKEGFYYSKNGKVVGKNKQLPPDFDPQLCMVELKKLIVMNAKIEVKEMPEFNVAYVRHTGAFNQIGPAYEKLMRWAGPRGLLSSPDVKTITVVHDDPSITSIEKVRSSACIILKEDLKVEGEIGKMTVPGDKYAVGRFEIGKTEFEKAWNSMCLWFTESGYQQGDGCTYELYHNNHTEHPKQKFIVDICIPIKPL